MNATVLLYAKISSSQYSPEALKSNKFKGQSKNDVEEHLASYSYYIFINVNYFHTSIFKMKLPFWFELIEIVSPYIHRRSFEQSFSMLYVFLVSIHCQATTLKIKIYF